jgi:hypothetical protein
MADVAPASRHRFVFIGGLHRSGTSLLFRILRGHPQVSGFRDTGVPEDEGQLLQSVYPPAREFGGPGRFGFEQASFLDETSPLASAANAARLFREWSRHWNLHAPVLLEKSPPNLVRGRFLQALFPHSQFLMLLRHPIAVALATHKWSRTGLESLIEHWLICHERYAADRDRLRSLLTLKYEDLVGQPERVLSGVWEFLGLPPVPPGETVDPAVNDRYFSRWRELQRHEPQRIERLVAACEPRVAAFGYSLRVADADACGDPADNHHAR